MCVFNFKVFVTVTAAALVSDWYGTRLGDLEENWFLCFPIKHSTHTLGSGPMLAALAVSELPAALQ